MEKRALANSRRPDHASDLAPRNREVDPAQNLDTALAEP
jgi:hypothetical protein